MRFLHLVHLNEILQNKLIGFLDPPDPLPLPPPVASNEELRINKVWIALHKLSLA